MAFDTRPISIIIIENEKSRGIKMKTKQINKIVIASLFAAIICVLNISVHIPLPSGYGYINISDVFVLVAGFFLGPVYAIAAAAIGSGLSDLILGFAVYIPATALIKGLCAFIIWFVSSRFKNKKYPAIITGVIAGEIPVPLLYLFYEYVILKYGQAAIVNVPFNFIQAGISALIAVFMIITINKADFIKKYL